MSADDIAQRVKLLQWMEGFLRVPLCSGFVVKLLADTSGDSTSQHLCTVMEDGKARVGVIEPLPHKFGAAAGRATFSNLFDSSPMGVLHPNVYTDKPEVDTIAATAFVAKSSVGGCANAIPTLAAITDDQPLEPAKDKNQVAFESACSLARSVMASFANETWGVNAREGAFTPVIVDLGKIYTSAVSASNKQMALAVDEWVRGVSVVKEVLNINRHYLKCNAVSKLTKIKEFSNVIHVAIDFMRGLGIYLSANFQLLDLHVRVFEQGTVVEGTELLLTSDQHFSLQSKN